MSALAWIFVGLIALSLLGVIQSIRGIGKPRKPLDATYACVNVVTAAAFICLYVATIRALS